MQPGALKGRNIMQPGAQGAQHHRAARQVAARRGQEGLHQAWDNPTAEQAERVLGNLARRLDHDAPGVSASVREGLDEMLTVIRLSLPDQLRRSLGCTNAIESLYGRPAAGLPQRCAISKRCSATSPLPEKIWPHRIQSIGCCNQSQQAPGPPVAAVNESTRGEQSQWAIYSRMDQTMSFGARSASKAGERGTYSWLITTRRQTQGHLTTTVATSRQHTKSWLRISQFCNPSGVANLACEGPSRPCRALGKNKKSGAISSNISRSCRHRANEGEVGAALSAPTLLLIP
jgi:hypothetical protein